MDRYRFVELAPWYYALAIALLLSETENALSITELLGQNGIEEPLLFARAMSFLDAEHLIVAIDDEFAPSLIRKTADFSTEWARLAQDESFQFYKYQMSGKSADWLNIAISNINKTFRELKITEKDLDRKPRRR
jgi:hypothetical protein